MKRIAQVGPAQQVQLDLLFGLPEFMPGAVIERAADGALSSNESPHELPTVTEPMSTSVSADMKNEHSKRGAPSTTRRGEVGGKFTAGEVLMTASGRETAPFPDIKWTSDQAAARTLKGVEQWLMQSALDEARARGDRFNALQFEANLKRPSQADKDSAEQYLFGEQTPVIQNALNSLVSDAGDVSSRLTVGGGDAHTNSLQREAENPSSWVIRNKDTAAVIMETYDPKKVAALNTDKYEAVPALQHLQELNDPNSKARQAAEYAAYRKERKQSAEKCASQGRAPNNNEVPLTLKLHRDFMENHVQILADLERLGLMDALRRQAPLRNIDHWDSTTIAAKGDDYVRLVQSGAVPVEIAKWIPEVKVQAQSASAAGKYVIAEQRAVKRGDREGGQPAFEWIPDERLGTFDTITAAKASFVRQMDPSLKDADDDHAAKHFGRGSLTGYKVVQHTAAVANRVKRPRVQRVREHGLSDAQINEYAQRLGNTPDNVRRIAAFQAAQGVEDVTIFLEDSIRANTEYKLRAAKEKEELAGLTGQILIRDDKAYQLEPIDTDRRVRHGLHVQPVKEFPTQGVDLWERYLGHPESPFVKSLLLAAQAQNAAGQVAGINDVGSESREAEEEPTDELEPSIARRRRP